MRPVGFIFMLTRGDRTVADAAVRLQDVLASGVSHIGFKDIGLGEPDLLRLATAIRRGGARLYLEVVSLDAASEAASARMAVTLGVDYLLGGTRPEVVLPILVGRAIRYYPFAGRVCGHPSRLEGSVDEIAGHAAQLAAMDGVHGVDLLAYRSACDVGALMRRVCTGIGKPVIVAGSIDRESRIAEAIGCGAAGLTVGTAALDGVFPARSAGLRDQIAYIQTAIAAGSAGVPA